MKGVIFDMDGVLFDTESIWQSCWHATAEELGINLDSSFSTDIGGSNGTCMTEVVQKYFHRENVSDIISEVYDMVHVCLKDSVPEKPGLHEIMEHVKRMGYKLAIASASPPDIIANNLTLAGIMSYFDVLISSDEVIKGKPDPMVFTEAARRLGLPNEECYVIEDAINGVVAGYRSGSQVIMVIDKIEPTPEIEKLCYKVCRNLYEVIPQIKEVI